MLGSALVDDAGFNIIRTGTAFPQLEAHAMATAIRCRLLQSV